MELLLFNLFKKMFSFEEAIKKTKEALKNEG